MQFAREVDKHGCPTYVYTIVAPTVTYEVSIPYTYTMPDALQPARSAHAYTVPG